MSEGKQPPPRDPTPRRHRADRSRRVITGRQPIGIRRSRPDRLARGHRVYYSIGADGRWWRVLAGTYAEQEYETAAWDAARLKAAAPCSGARRDHRHRRAPQVSLVFDALPPRLPKARAAPASATPGSMRPAHLTQQMPRVSDLVCARERSRSGFWLSPARVLDGESDDAAAAAGRRAAAPTAPKPAPLPATPAPPPVAPSAAGRRDDPVERAAGREPSAPSSHAPTTPAPVAPSSRCSKSGAASDASHCACSTVRQAQASPRVTVDTPAAPARTAAPPAATVSAATAPAPVEHLGRRRAPGFAAGPAEASGYPGAVSPGAAI